MIKKLLRSSAIAVLATVAIAAPTFAGACNGDGKLSGTGALPAYPKLAVGANQKVTVDGKQVTATVKCGAQINIGDANNPKYEAIYAVTSGDCAQAGAVQANPNGACKAENDLTSIVSTIINTIVFVVGIIAVVMIVIGGINYAMSQGDPGKVKKAKDTILYGIIGLVVALLAFAIVQFVLGALQG